MSHSKICVFFSRLVNILSKPLTKILSLLLFCICILVLTYVGYKFYVQIITKFQLLHEVFILGKMESIASIGSFIVATITLLILYHEYTIRLNAASNLLTIRFEIKPQFILSDTSYISCGTHTKFIADTNKLILFKGNELIENSSDYLHLIDFMFNTTKKEYGKKILFFDKLKNITNGNLNLFFRQNDDPQKIEIVPNFMKTYKIGIYQNYDFVINGKHCSIAISLNNCLLFQKKFMYLKLHSKTGTTTIKNIEIKTKLNFNTDNRILGSKDDFLRESTHFNYVFSISNLQDNSFVVPIVSSTSNLFVVCDNIEITFYSSFSKKITYYYEDFDLKIHNYNVIEYDTRGLK